MGGNHPYYHRMKYSLLIAATLFLTAAHAQIEMQEEFLFWAEERLVVTATRNPILLSKAPGAVTVITEQQIEALGATSLADLLRLVPGANIRMTPMGNHISFRSFGSSVFSERVLFLIDGMPYNSPDKGGLPAHPGYELFPLELIKRIEVIRGPGSSLYGANAFGGTVNILTKSGRDFEGSKIGLKAGQRETLRNRA